MNFEFATATRILFGPGILARVGPLAAELGARALVVTGQSGAHRAALLDTLTASGVACSLFIIASEPTVEMVREGRDAGREAGCDLVIGLGGGSALDAGKAIAALLANPGEPLDYLEVIGRGEALTTPSLPYIAIPTTAGTGAEVTRNAVLASPEHGVKASLRSPWMLPRVALVDPDLTLTLPPALTAATGLDALTQLIEPFVSHRANPLTDGFCREGISRVARSLRRAYYEGDDHAAREDMALASLLGGLALANAGLGAAHGFAAPIGGRFPAPHGAVCAALLPPVMEANLNALRMREPTNPALGRYEEVARLLTGDPAATADEGAAWVRALRDELNVPPLSAYGITSGDLPALVDDASRASSMKANPLPLTHHELEEVIQAAAAF